MFYYIDFVGLVDLVRMVSLVCFVYLVCLVDFVRRYLIRPEMIFAVLSAWSRMRDIL